MRTDRVLPRTFLKDLDILADAYLAHDDPIRQSGFGGGEFRWRQEREPILDGVTGSGSLIDMGCANGHLVECLMAWGRERGLDLDPYGLDYSPKLIALARARLPQWASQFFVGNAWTWMVPRRFDFVYSLYDNVPEDFLAEYVQRLVGRIAAPGGRVIIGAYGSRSKQQPACDVGGFLAESGIHVSGCVTVGELPEARFAWIDA
jgi:hypothetical protein